MYGGHKHRLRQTVIGLVAGAELGEHNNPGGDDAARVARPGPAAQRGHLAKGRHGDLLVVSQARHSLKAIEASAVLLVVVTQATLDPM